MTYAVKVRYALAKSDWEGIAVRVSERVGAALASATLTKVDLDAGRVAVDIGCEAAGGDPLGALESALSATDAVWREELGHKARLVSFAVADRSADAALILSLPSKDFGNYGRPIESGKFRVSTDRHRDVLECTQVGRVLDGFLERHTVDVGDDFRWIFDGRTKELVGFRIKNFADFDLEADQYASLWRPPLLDVATLGVRGANAGTIVALTRMRFGEQETPDTVAFERAVTYSDSGPDRSLEHTAELWREALALGAEQARFALGYALIDLKRYREAHEELRHYVRIDETNGWGWVYLGVACEALADWEGADYAYRQAIRLEQEGGFETDAQALLDLMPVRRKGREGGAPFEIGGAGWPQGHGE